MFKHLLNPILQFSFLSLYIPPPPQVSNTQLCASPVLEGKNDKNVPVSAPAALPLNATTHGMASGTRVSLHTHSSQ